jgi:hypothetical protein
MKPVAWMDYLEHSNVYDLNVSGRGIPLYTAPRELSDEEIHEICKLKDVWIEQEDGSIKLSPYNFAKELLKKASQI